MVLTALLHAAVWLALAGLPAPGPSATAPGADAPNGVFLVARPTLKDPSFRGSVVLVTHPGRGAPFGVIINRPLANRLSEVFPGHLKLRSRSDTVFFGGPVAQRSLVFVLRGPQPVAGGTPVLKDVHVTTHPDAAEAVLRRDDAPLGLRVYAGYAGWAPGQLQIEIDRGDWYVLPADATTIFDTDPKTIWPELIKRATSMRQTGKMPDSMHSSLGWGHSCA